MHGNMGGGDGTQSNPYLIEDIEDFDWLCERNFGAVAKYIVLKTDIDINDSKNKNKWDKRIFGHGTGQISIKGGENENAIDGKYTIKNLVIEHRSAFTYYVMSNINMTNLILLDYSYFRELTDCNFSIFLSYVGSDVSSPNLSSTATRCSFNIKGIDHKLLICDNSKLCHYKYDFLISGSMDSVNGLISPGQSKTFSFVYVDGKIYFKSLSNEVALFCGSASKNTPLKNSYFSCEMEYSSPIKIALNNDFNTPILFNKDKIRIKTPEGEDPIYIEPTTTYFTNTNNAYCVTNSQLKDVDYLNSIGFICVKADDD